METIKQNALLLFPKENHTMGESVKLRFWNRNIEKKIVLTMRIKEATGGQG